MFITARKYAVVLAICLMAAAGHADGWSSWGSLNNQNLQFGAFGPRLASDGTNLYYSTILDGVFRASFADHNFTALPMTGFPLWTNGSTTNLLALTDIAVTPQGTLVIAGSPFNIITNTLTFNPPGGAANTLPVIYWWDETNQLWQPATISGKTYPYTGNVCNFSIAPDGSLWTGSGFFPYVYHSTDGGRSYTAIDINARVPTNYFPIPLTSNISGFGEIFSICAGWNNEVVIGTETGGYLHSTNGGASWTSLDPNFTDPNSVNPLGRIGDARVAGLDRYGNFICGNGLTVASPAQNIWGNVPLIGWRPRDGLIFNASSGLATNLGGGRIVNTPAGEAFIFLKQNYLLQGGVYRQTDGHHWTQFNQGSGLDFPFAPGITNAFGPGDCIMALSNVVFIGTAGAIYTFDTTPPPVTNRPPVALPQNMTLFENAPTNLTLTAHDADSDALDFQIVNPPAHGSLSGTPPDVTYTPSNNFAGLDAFTFAVTDNKATSAPVFVNLYVNQSTNTPSSVTITSPLDGKVFTSPTDITLSANASDADGISQVLFYSGSFNNGLGGATNPPYTITLTNLPVGEYTFSARAFDAKGARTWSRPVRITILPTAARLNIQPAQANDVALSWPLELDGFFLESSPSANGPWALATNAPLFFERGQTVALPDDGQQFFRLMRPH